MKKEIKVLLIISIFLVNLNLVLAHPGRTDSSGCHKCNTNCEKWGLSTGEYHCHNGSTYKNSKGQTFNSDGSLIKESVSNNNTNSSNKQEDIKEITSKSSDNTLKKITIDENNIEVLDNMIYETKKDKINILVETNNDKAVYEISNTSLVTGNNTIVIKVTAENGDIKNYNLTVKKEELSNNTKIKIVVDDKKITFLNRIAKVDVSPDTKDLNYEYELEDNKSTVTIYGDKDLEEGENRVSFIVKAEDGTDVKYELIVNKLSSNDEVVGSILGLGVLGGLGYGIYMIIKKKKV